jgi:hypothetical protein
MAFDPEEAARLSALGIVDGRTMVPAGLVPPPDDHPFWPELARRLERAQPLDPATWAMVEEALHPAHPSWDAVAPHLLARTGQPPRPATPDVGRIRHGGGA